jgi:uncharacterized protein with PIN domain
VSLMSHFFTYFTNRFQLNSVHQIRFVTDYMMGSLGKLLRTIGIDTIILKGNFVDHDECIRISMGDDRIILTGSRQLMSQRVRENVAKN